MADVVHYYKEAISLLKARTSLYIIVYKLSLPKMFAKILIYGHGTYEVLTNAPSPSIVQHRQTSLACLTCTPFSPRPCALLSPIPGGGAKPPESGPCNGG